MEQYEAEWAKVYFTEEEKKRCQVEGAKRYFSQRARGNEHIEAYKNIQGGMTKVQQDQLSTLAELLVVKYLELPTFDLRYWSYFVTDPALYAVPEVCGVVEVRRVNQPYNSLVVREKDKNDDALNVKVFIPFDSDGERITGTHGYGYVQGWRYATDVWEKGTYKDRDSRKTNRLNDPDTLLSVFEKRMAAKGWPV